MTNFHAGTIAREINDNFGAHVATVFNENTIGLDGGIVVSVKKNLNSDTAMLESYKMNPTGTFIRTWDTNASASFADTIDYICSKVSVTSI